MLEFRGTCTAFISDLASVSHYVHVRVVNPSKYFAAIPMHSTLVDHLYSFGKQLGTPVANGSRHIDKNPSVNAQIIKNNRIFHLFNQNNRFDVSHLIKIIGFVTFVRLP